MTRSTTRHNCPCTQWKATSWILQGNGG